MSLFRFLGQIFTPAFSRHFFGAVVYVGPFPNFSVFFLEVSVTILCMLELKQPYYDFIPVIESKKSLNVLTRRNVG